MEDSVERHVDWAENVQEIYPSLDEDFWEALGLAHSTDPVEVSQQSKVALEGLDGYGKSFEDVTPSTPVSEKRLSRFSGHFTSTRTSSTARTARLQRSRSRKSAPLFTIGDSSSDSETSVISRATRKSQPIPIKRSITFADVIKPVNDGNYSTSPESNSATADMLANAMEDYSTSWDDRSSQIGPLNDPMFLQRIDHASDLSPYRSLLSTLLEEPVESKAATPSDEQSFLCPALGPQHPIPSTMLTGMDQTAPENQTAVEPGAELCNDLHMQSALGEFCYPAELCVNLECSTPDSECSWTEADDQEQWQILLQEQLAAFRQQTARTSMITNPLTTQQRRQVHALAQLMRLSHTSLGNGKCKRLLLSKCVLVSSNVHNPSAGRWNPFSDHWLEGWIDPRLIVIENVSWAIPPSHLLSTWPAVVPNNILILKKDDRETFAAYAFFDNAQSAASAILSIHGAEPDWNSLHLECDYLRLPGKAGIIDVHCVDLLRLAQAASSFQHGQEDCMASMLGGTASAAQHSQDWPIGIGGSQRFSGLWSPPTKPTPVRHGLSNVACASFSTASTAPESASIGRSSMDAHSSVMSMSSLALSDYGSETSVAKKRKRQPLGSYVCSHAGCDKIFERAGDCRKHEKVHAMDRPHRCAVCNAGFMYPKDLRRHFVRTRHDQTVPPTESVMHRSSSCNAL